MGKKAVKKATSGKLTVNMAKRSGQYKSTNYCDVYRDGKAYIYTAWSDNEPEVGTEMSFETWLKAYQ